MSIKLAQMQKTAEEAYVLGVMEALGNSNTSRLIKEAAREYLMDKISKKQDKRDQKKQKKKDKAKRQEAKDGRRTRAQAAESRDIKKKIEAAASKQRAAALQSIESQNLGYTQPQLDPRRMADSPRRLPATSSAPLNRGLLLGNDPLVTLRESRLESLAGGGRAPLDPSSVEQARSEFMEAEKARRVNSRVRHRGGLGSLSQGVSVSSPPPTYAASFPADPVVAQAEAQAVSQAEAQGASRAEAQAVAQAEAQGASRAEAKAAGRLAKLKALYGGLGRGGKAGVIASGLGLAGLGTAGALGAFSGEDDFLTRAQQGDLTNEEIAMLAGGTAALGAGGAMLL